MEETAIIATPLVYRGSVGWKLAVHLGIEVFTSPEGIEYVRVRADETPAAIIEPKTRGLGPTRLVPRAESETIKRADKKERRRKTELRRRGYDV